MPSVVISLNWGQVLTKITPAVLVEMERVIGARSHTRLDPAATIFINLYNPIGPLGQGVGRTRLHTGRIVAMKTEDR